MHLLQRIDIWRICLYLHLDCLRNQHHFSRNSWLQLCRRLVKTHHSISRNDWNYDVSLRVCCKIAVYLFWSHSHLPQHAHSTLQQVAQEMHGEQGASQVSQWIVRLCRMHYISVSFVLIAHLKQIHNFLLFYGSDLLVKFSAKFPQYLLSCFVLFTQRDNKPPLRVWWKRISVPLF